VKTTRVLVRERLQAAECVIKKKTSQFIMFVFFLQQNNHNHKLIVSLQCNKQCGDVNFLYDFPS